MIILYLFIHETGHMITYLLIYYSKRKDITIIDREKIIKNPVTGQQATYCLINVAQKELAFIIIRSSAVTL